MEMDYNDFLAELAKLAPAKRGPPPPRSIETLVDELQVSVAQDTHTHTTHCVEPINLLGVLWQICA